MKSVIELVDSFRNEKNYYEVGKLIFNGVEGYDVYNPTAPFYVDGKKIIIARVEKRDSEQSLSIFFEETERNVYTKLENYPVFELQDPYISVINGEYIFGGTEIFINETTNNIEWQAAFYRGKDLLNMERFLTGPKGMKDIRLVELVDKKIGVFSRPQGEKGGRGKIGFTIAESLETITPELIYEAPLLEQLIDEDWCGANELHLLENGNVGVLGHVARYSEGTVRHYYPAVFTLNPVTGEYSDFEIIAERDDLIPGCSKRIDLVDVLFSAGILIEEDKAILYTGVSDCEVQYAVIDNPFK